MCMVCHGICVTALVFVSLRMYTYTTHTCFVHICVCVRINVCKSHLLNDNVCDNSVVLINL